MKNVYIVGGGFDYAALFKELGFNITSEITQASLVCFTGGADVTPELYGDDKHPYTGNDPSRDKHEMVLYAHIRDLDIPMVGICRGAQFLNVMSGGRMYQHVEKHTRSHAITDLQTGETIWVSSTHHQMIMPSPEAVLVASSTLGGEREWYEGQVFKKDISQEDIEVVFYEKTKCLCFQPHPEFDYPEYEGMRKYFGELLKKYLNV